MPECQGRPHIWQTTELEREVELRSMALVVRCSECSVGHLLEVLPASDRPEEEDRIRTYLRVFPASGETEPGRGVLALAALMWEQHVVGWKSEGFQVDSGQPATGNSNPVGFRQRGRRHRHRLERRRRKDLSRAVQRRLE